MKNSDEKQKVQNKMKRIKANKIVNFRLFLCYFLLVIISIFLTAFFRWNALYFNSIFIIITFVFVIYQYKNKKSFQKFLFVTISCMIVFTICSMQYIWQMDAFNHSETLDCPVNIRGTIQEMQQYSNFHKNFLVKTQNITTADGKKLKNCSIQLDVIGENSLQIGNTITFTANLKQNTFQHLGENSYFFIHNIRYTCTVKATDIILVNWQTNNIFVTLRQRIYQLLFANFDEDVASFAYAMLIGDNAFLHADTLQNIRYAGIAHIFAISGLHIAILYGILQFLMHKIPIHKSLKYIGIVGILFFYTGICGWNASTLRAAFMASVALFTRYTFQYYDSFHSLLFAGTVILLLQPIQLFAVGFQLSMVAVFALNTVTRHILRIIPVRRKWIKRGLQAIIMPLSVQIATFPFLLNYFGYTSLLSVFTNLIIVPIVSIIFLLLFIAMLLALCFPVIANVILYIPMKLLSFLVQPLILFSFKILLITGFSFGIGSIFAWLLILLIITDKVNLSIFSKTIVVCALAGGIVVGLLVHTIIPNMHTQLIVAQYYQSHVILWKENKKNYLVTDVQPNKKFLENLFLKENIKSLEGLYLLTENENCINQTIPLVHRLAYTHNVYLTDNYLTSSFSGITIHNMRDPFLLGSMHGNLIGRHNLYLSGKYGNISIIFQYEGHVYPKIDFLISIKKFENLENSTQIHQAVYLDSFSNIETIYFILKEGDIQNGFFETKRKLCKESISNLFVTGR